ncbi:MAG: glycosyltransferase family 39 protein [Planctomycetota bacterium]
MSAAPPSTPSFWPRVALVLTVALVFRLVAHPQMARAADTFAPIVDSEAYLLQALRVAGGVDAEEGVYFQAPLYPWLLGSTLRLCGVPGFVGAQSAADVPSEIRSAALRVGRGLNLVLGLLAVALIARVGHVLAGAGAGLAAGLLAALYAPFVAFEGLLLKGSLSLLFLPLAVLAAARAWRLGSARSFLWCGLALGLGGLVRANLQPLALLAVLSLLVWGLRQRRLRHALLASAALLLGVALAVLPVVTRNSSVAGQLVLSTAAGGTAFYQCNHPDNPTGLMKHSSLVRQVPQHELQDFTALAEERLGRRLTPAEVSNYWYRETLAAMAERPGTWLLAELRKLALLFSRYEPMDNSMPEFAASAAPVLGWSPVTYGLVLPLAVAGLWLGWRRRRDEAEAGGRLALLLGLCGYGGTLLLFVVSARYRLPLVPLVIVAAGYLLARLGTLLSAATRPRERWQAGGALLGGLALSFVSESPLGPITERERATDWVVCLMNRAQIARERFSAAALRGDVSGAESAWRAARQDLEAAVVRGHAARIRSVRLHAELAALDRLKAQLETDPAQRQALLTGAAEQLELALSIDRHSAVVHRQRGLLLYDLDRLAEAAQAFGQALQALPRDREARQYRALCTLQLGQAAAAEEDARWLTEHDAEADDGWGLLSWSLGEQGRLGEARSALERYDRLATMREASGLARRLPEIPYFATLRAAP